MEVKLEGVSGANLLAAIENKVGCAAHTPCRRRGICGACEVKILEGEALEGGVLKGPGDTLKSCRSTAKSENLKLKIRESLFSKSLKIESDFTILRDVKFSHSSGNSAALDIGTTTLAAICFENKSGKILKKASALNAQAKYADNVIERINCAGNPDKLKLMHEAVADCANSLLKSFDCGFDRLFVAANTSMLHLFCGIDPSSMGAFPYTPKFLDSMRFSAREILKTERDFEVVLLPSASAFIGADIMAGALASDFSKAPSPALFVDIGTNGEILLNSGGKIFSASAAAGPAFEGYGLSCGMRADAGAISKVEISKSFKVKFETISGKAPGGICGSGYVDFLAQARRSGLIGESGRFCSAAPLREVEKRRVFELAEGVHVSEGDIANLLKSKAAVNAAISVLLEESGLKAGDVKSLFVAGGFGKNLNFKSAVECGLIPEFSADTRFLGNTSLAGAYICALDDDAISELSEFSKKIENVDLNSSESFEDAFIDSLFLP